MDDFDMHFLYPVRKSLVRNINEHISDTGQLPAAFARERDHFHASAFSSLRSADDVGRISAGADREQDIAFAAHCLDKARKDKFIAIVVGRAAEVRRVGNGDRCQSRTVATVAPAELFGKMHGIAHAPAVAARDDLPAALQADDHKLAGSLNRFNIPAVFQKGADDPLRFFEFLLY